MPFMAHLGATENGIEPQKRREVSLVAFVMHRRAISRPFHAVFSYRAKM